jgi:hypothetical protein
MSEIEKANSLRANIAYGYQVGWSFTPLNGKAPITKGWQQRPRETLEDALAWADKGNVGLRTGRASGVFVIDLDEYKEHYDPDAVAALNLSDTVTVRSGGGGTQLYYALTDGVELGNSSGKLAPAVETKGNGGQVVFPGSVHPDTGKPYEWAEGHEPWNIALAPLPQPIIDLLKAPLARPRARSAPPDGSAPAPARGATSHYALTAMQLELSALCAAGNGNRNNTLNRAAFNLGTLVGGGHLDRAEVEAALRSAAVSAGLESGEIEATIRSGLDAGIQRPRRIKEKPAPRAARARPDYILTPGPHVDGNGVYTEQSTATFAAAVLAELPEDLIYRKDFIPGEILGPAGKQKWVEFTPDRMRLVVDGQTKLGKWVTSRKTGEQVLIYQACAKDGAGLVIAHAQQAPNIRELELMVSYPVYGPDFTRIPPGWHDGLYYDEPKDLQNLVPETDCEVIHNILHDLVVDFPFKTEADRQNFFGLLLTPIVTPALDGNRPMHLINSPLERTGKSKLVNEVLGGILIGRDVASMQITDREEEREKRIIAALIQGDTLLHLDNLPHYIDSQSLASLLTSHILGGRILGISRTVKLQNNLIVVGSGNNVQASGEVAKRIVPVMIEPMTAHPEHRTDFQHPDIRAYARERRRVVLECLLGLVENWRAAGRPAHPNRFGGFENWSETIGGILKVNALNAWRTNEADWRKLADPKGAEMEAFVTAWYAMFKNEEKTPSELLELARSQELFAPICARRSPQAVGAAFGKMLTRHVDQPVDKWFIRRGGTATHAAYFLKPVIQQK